MFNKMFSDIGKKIKGLASVLFVLGAIGAFIAGLMFMATAGGKEEEIIVGFLIMVGGTLCSWISSGFLYGFGEIIDKLQDIERNTRQIQKNTKRIKNTKVDNTATEEYVCPRCHRPSCSTEPCEHCGHDPYDPYCD